jgi:hypothetical protein
MSSDDSSFIGDDSRARVIELYCNFIGRLVAGSLVDLDRYNSLLLGRKAVGETSTASYPKNRRALRHGGSRLHPNGLALGS